MRAWFSTPDWMEGNKTSSTCQGIPFCQPCTQMFSTEQLEQILFMHTVHYQYVSGHFKVEILTSSTYGTMSGFDWMMNCTLIIFWCKQFTCHTQVFLRSSAVKPDWTHKILPHAQKWGRTTGKQGPNVHTFHIMIDTSEHYNNKAPSAVFPQS